MDRRSVLKALAGFALCPVCANFGFAAEAAHWSYEGAHGPGHWGDLDPADRVCAVGGQQSPIVIDSSIEAQLAPLEFAWARQAETIVNNGHTIQLNFDDGGTLTIGSDDYTLGAVSLPSPERASHRRQRLSDGGAFRPSQRRRFARRDRRDDGGWQAKSGVRQDRGVHASRRKARRSRPIRALIRTVCCPRTAGIIFIPDRSRRRLAAKLSIGWCCPVL